MNNGIQPTVELATNNGNGYPYPVMPYSYGNNNDGFFGGEGIWAIILLALLFGNGGFGFGGFGGFGGGMFEFPWLLNGQQGINTNTNNGFNSLHLSNQIEGVRDGISGLSNQLCNCCSDINSTIANGFYNSEVAACNRQMADMNQNFNNQIATLNGFNGLQKSLDTCCCENRLGIANLNSTILSENCADRAALADGVRDIITSQNNGVQRILDQLCNDKIDSKNEKIADLQREILMKDLQASQIAQNSFIAQGFANEVDSLYNRLSSCPVPSTPVYGRTPIFNCPNNNGCGCNGYATNLI